VAATEQILFLALECSQVDCLGVVYLIKMNHPKLLRELLLEIRFPDCADVLVDIAYKDGDSKA
jgi:hypothetical protein